ncbi:MAG TPA: molybdenum cofactor guanylyltransferase MobA [Pseudomonadales bacterium]|nr:molybdenum cofactor guanylyltransferase MobA [Pseudomonadales bacterium]
MRAQLILPEVQAAILAGGKSRRMGKPKLFLDFRGNTFIAHLLLQLQSQVNDVMIAGAPDPRQLADLGVTVLADAVPDCGPLGGIATALQHARRQWLLIAPCDNPLLPTDYAVRMLHTARERHAPLVFVRKQGREQPMYALLRCDLRDSLEQYLASGERKVMPWYQSAGAVPLDWDDAGSAFENLNTPEDYAAFLAANT